jgi:hypothetical protein
MFKDSVARDLALYEAQLDAGERQWRDSEWLRIEKANEIADCVQNETEPSDAAQRERYWRLLDRYRSYLDATSGMILLPNARQIALRNIALAVIEEAANKGDRDLWMTEESA